MSDDRITVEKLKSLMGLAELPKFERWNDDDLEWAPFAQSETVRISLGDALFIRREGLSKMVDERFLTDAFSIWFNSPWSDVEEFQQNVDDD